MNDIDENLEQAESKGLGLTMPSRKDIGWLLVGGGAVASLVNLLRGERGPVDWLVPMSLAGLGFGILLQGRHSEISSAEKNILAELDRLDPIARAQVLGSVARDEVERLPGIGSSD